MRSQNSHHSSFFVASCDSVGKATDGTLLFDLTTPPLTAASAKPTHQKFWVQNIVHPICRLSTSSPLSSSLTHHWCNHIYVVSFSSRICAKLLHLHKQCNTGRIVGYVPLHIVHPPNVESHAWQSTWKMQKWLTSKQERSKVVRAVQRKSS